MDETAEILATLKANFDSDDNAFIDQTEPLTQSDLAMIGSIIQLYCYADFNARRIVNALRHAATGEPKSVSRLQDAQVFPALEKLVRDHLWDSDMKNGLLKAAATVEMHRMHRHNFAHWATRRIKGANALIMFTKNAKEAERRDGQTQEAGAAKYGILSLDRFPEEIRKLEGHTNYLALTSAHIDTHLAEIAQEMERRRAGG